MNRIACERRSGLAHSAQTMLEAVDFLVKVTALSKGAAYLSVHFVRGHDRAPLSKPLSAMRSLYSKFRPTRRATVSRIWTMVPESRILCLPENSET